MTTEELQELAIEQATGWQGEIDYSSSNGYQAGFWKQNQLAITLLQQKQAAIINRHVEFSSDKQVLAVLRELLEELTIQP